MKIKVIFIPYCNFATSGLSELEWLSVVEVGKERYVVHKGEHLSADREGKGHDEEHEESHLCYKQEEDLDDIALADRAGMQS